MLGTTVGCPAPRVPLLLGARCRPIGASLHGGVQQKVGPAAGALTAKTSLRGWAPMLPAGPTAAARAAARTLRRRQLTIVAGTPAAAAQRREADPDPLRDALWAVGCSCAACPGFVPHSCSAFPTGSRSMHWHCSTALTATLPATPLLAAPLPGQYLCPCMPYLASASPHHLALPYPNFLAPAYNPTPPLTSPSTAANRTRRC